MEDLKVESPHPSGARRGDLVVMHTRSSSYAMNTYERTETDSYDVGIVTSVTRDGTVKRWRRCDDLALADYLGRPNRGQELPRTGFQHCYVMSAGDIWVAASLATAACHVWERHQTTQGYESLDAARDALRPHLKRMAGWEALNGAAEAWEAARRAADAAYREASEQANRAHAQAGYHTRAGNELRNELDRAAMGAHSAAVKAANDAYRAVYASVTQAPNVARVA